MALWVSLQPQFQAKSSNDLLASSGVPPNPLTMTLGSSSSSTFLQNSESFDSARYVPEEDIYDVYDDDDNMPLYQSGDSDNDPDLVYDENEFLEDDAGDFDNDYP